MILLIFKCYQLFAAIAKTSQEFQFRKSESSQKNMFVNFLNKHFQNNYKLFTSLKNIESHSSLQR